MSMWENIVSGPYKWGRLDDPDNEPPVQESLPSPPRDPLIVQGSHRTVYVNDPRAGMQFGYKNNSVSTTKYTSVSFLPKGLFEQFRRVANLYFLLIAILSATPVSPVHPMTNIAPLVLVLAASLIKEAFEDRKRHTQDKIINATITEVLRANEWVVIPWSAVRVGDIVRVKGDHYFPADLLCLASTNSDGICYIETSNLDGETNLKIRRALERTWDYVTADAAHEFKGMVECEQPNNSLYTFTGNLVVGKQTISISPNQILLRGCSLRNTDWVVGAVIFTGHETKVMMNTMDVPSKRSTLERRMDVVILILFGILFTLCFIGGVASAAFLDRKYWFLQLKTGVDAQYDPSNGFVVASLTFFTLVTLFATVIPISLYVSIEMIKFIQSTQYINKDLNMYHKESDTPALARTSNLNEELGQVEYIFSDKTGTLTRNQMEFFKCSIAGVTYGTGVTEIQRAAALRTGIPVVEGPKSDEAIREKGFNFDDRRLMRGAWRQEPTADICKEFFRLLAICHTVLPEGNENPDEIEYLAASPDEAAMVAAAKNFGFFFYRRTPTSIVVRESHVEKLGRVADVEYEILNVLEFNSTRKRQSVVCRFPDGRIVLYCKGADQMIFHRLAEAGNAYVDITRDSLEKFGCDGLRTLCLAFRELDPAFYEEWNQRYVQAKSALREREKRLDEVAELIEKNLILLGCTAIEDKLQEGVPACIRSLKRAGIKIWVLTGDKMETAINIAYACSLLSNDMKQFIISSETEVIRAIEEQGDPVETARAIRESVFQQLRESLRDALVIDREGFPFALVIDGRCLMYALDPLMRATLLQLGMMSKAVVCCRVSPLQKAQVTTLMREGANKITLSIGDGANDVSMIQAAHVGVGVSGAEGMQAVMAADFAIAQFRFLTDLLLVHGRWSYIRLSKVVAYFFYKNLAFTLTLFWFNSYAGFSGQRYYDDWFQSLYNVFFTCLPVIVVGIFDKDIDAKRSKEFPELYRAGIENRYFSWSVLSTWLFFAVYHSVVMFAFPSSASIVPITSNGRVLGVWDVGSMTYAVIIVVVNVKLLMVVSFFTKWHFLSVAFSIGLWFVLTIMYDAIDPARSSWDAQSNQYWVIYVVMSTAYFWSILLLTPFVALLPDYLFNGLQRWIWPADYQIIQENVKFVQQPGGEYDTRDRSLEMEALGPQPPSMNRAELRRQGMASLPQQASKKYTGFAFDTPGFESFFAQQEGVGAGGRAYDVARRASMRARRRTGPDDELPHFEKFPDQMPTPRHLRGLSPAGGAGGGGAAGGGPGYSEGGAFSSGNSSPTGSPMSVAGPGGYAPLGARGQGRGRGEGGSSSLLSHDNSLL